MVAVTILAPEVRTADLADVFRLAADIVQRNGLAKGVFVAPPAIPDADGVLHASDEAFRPVDVVGAIRIACGEDPQLSQYVPDVPVVAEAIRFASLHMAGEAPWTDGAPDYIEHVAFWNDLGATRWGDVIVQLRYWAIEAERELGRAA
jgi:hypothetical protein